MTRAELLQKRVQEETEADIRALLLDCDDDPEVFIDVLIAGVHHDLDWADEATAFLRLLNSVLDKSLTRHPRRRFKRSLAEALDETIKLWSVTMGQCRALSMAEHDRPDEPVHS